MNIIAKIGGLFIKKAAPTAGQKAGVIAKAAISAVRPYAVDGLKVAAGVAALYGGARLGISLVDNAEKVAHKGASAGKRAMETAGAAASMVKHKAAGAVGLATGIVLKATGVFKGPKKDSDEIVPEGLVPQEELI